MRALASAVRAQAWWEPKLATILGTGYATAFFLHVSVLRAAPTLLLTIAAVVPGAIYVSLINDITDLADDRAAGRTIGFGGEHRRVATLVAAACLAAGLVFSVLAWRDDPLALALYLGAWLSFSLYSLPPLRFKARGSLGVLADGAGAHLLPHLLVVAALYHHFGKSVDAKWMVTVGIWSGAWGLRSILIHQLDDAACDQASGARTFGRSHPRASVLLGAYVLFPVELVALCVLLSQAGSVIAIAALPAYGLFDLLRVRFLHVNLRVVSPATARDIALHDYYSVPYPLAFLFAATVRYPSDAAMLVAQMVVFPVTLSRLCVDASQLVRFITRGARRRVARQSQSTSI